MSSPRETDPRRAWIHLVEEPAEESDIDKLPPALRKKAVQALNRAEEVSSPVPFPIGKCVAAGLFCLVGVFLGLFLMYYKLSTIPIGFMVLCYVPWKTSGMFKNAILQTMRDQD